MTYLELAALSNKNLVQTLNKLSLDELVSLLKQSEQFYIHYSEQTDRYCSSVDEVMLRDEDNNPIAPKFNKSELISEEQFQSLMAKIKKCESIVSVILGSIAYVQAMQELDEKSSDILKSVKESEESFYNEKDKLSNKLSNVNM